MTKTLKKKSAEKQDELNQQLINAVWGNNLSVIKISVEDGADVNTKDKFGTPVLQINKEIKVTRYLLKAGANPDIQGNTGETALHGAVSHWNTNRVKLLLKYKADMYIKDGEGRTPFDLSLLHDFYDIAELFISNGYVPSEEGMQKVKNHRLIKAIEESDLSAVKAAIADGADVNAKDNNGEPLLLYTKFPDAKITRYLLENGMNPNMQNDYEQSLLHNMSARGAIDSIKILLEFGADMTVKSNWDETSFNEALNCERYDIAELFVMNGYVPSDEDFNVIKDITKRESLKVHFTTLAVQMQGHKAKLKEETVSQEFAYADEVIEM